MRHDPGEFPEDLPASIEDVGPEWLTGVLRRAGAIGPGSSVLEIEVEASAGIAFTAEVRRLRLAGRGDVSPSVIVKMPRRGRWYDQVYPAEVRFYRDWAPALSSIVPRCHLARMDAGAQRFVLVLEDLSPDGSGHQHDLAGVDRRRNEILLDGIADMHARYWDLGDEAIPTFTYDAAEIERAVGDAGRAWRSLECDDRYRVGPRILDRGAAVVDSLLTPALEAISRPPHTLVHADLHVENFLFQGDAVKIFDWQGASRGHFALDLPHALQGTRTDVRRAGEAELLERYRRRMQDGGVELAPGEMRAAVDHALVWLFADHVRALEVFERPPRWSDERFR